MATEAPGYVGNGHYCYANVTAMLLASIGERVAPGPIEALSGMGLGASWHASADLIFFGTTLPDLGITRALGLLGFEAVERASADGDPPPLDALAEALEAGPAILGPIDLGLLLYQPGKGRANGVDHFVLAYALEDDEVSLHDPAGFPHVSLSVDDLVAAWRAEQIGYRRGAFRWWTAPRRVGHPTDEEMARNAIEAFAAIYREANRDTPPGAASVGGTAILRLAERVRSGELPPSLYGHMTGFALPVAARRADDFAAFFAPRAPDLADLKEVQARLFGRAQTLLVRRDRAGAADTFAALAAVEDQIHDLLTAPALAV